MIIRNISTGEQAVTLHAACPVTEKKRMKNRRFHTDRSNFGRDSKKKDRLYVYMIRVQ
jgi:hypothetical protein